MADPYVCPRCGATAQGAAYCSACGLHLDAVGLPRRSEFTGPAPDLVEADVPNPHEQPRPRVTVAQRLFFWALVLVGAVLLGSPQDECGPFADAEDLAIGLLSGLLVAAIAIAVVASVVWAAKSTFRRMRARWSAYGWPVLAISAVFIVFGAVGQRMEQNERCDPSAATQPPAAIA